MEGAQSHQQTRERLPLRVRTVLRGGVRSQTAWLAGPPAVPPELALTRLQIAVPFRVILPSYPLSTLTPLLLCIDIIDGQYCLPQPVLVLQVAVRRLLGTRLQAGLRGVLPALDAALLVLPHRPRTGIAINRAVEEGSAHKNYFIEYHPRRNRLTHSLIFEEFEMVLEDWQRLEREYELCKATPMQSTARCPTSQPDRLNNLPITRRLCNPHHSCPGCISDLPTGR